MNPAEGEEGQDRSCMAMIRILNFIIHAMGWETLKSVNRVKERGRQRMGWLDSIIDSMDMNLSQLWEIVETEEPGML